MSDTPTPQSGPASANDHQLTGRFADEHNAGYRSMREPPRKSEEREFATGRQAAEELAKKRKPIRNVDPDPVQPLEYRDDRGKKISDRETITIERGADDLKAKRQTDALGKELHDRHNIAFQVDEMRKQAGVPTDPTAPVDPDQINPRLFGELPHQAPQIDPQHLPVDARPAPPGIDPEVHRAMQHPQVRQAMEQEFGKAMQLQQQHAQQVQVANDFALGTFTTVLPELANLRADQVAPFLEQMKRTNPARYNQAVKAANNVKQAQTARQQVEAQRAHVERQTFQRDAAAHDQAFERAVSHYTPEQRRAVTGEMVNYAASLGIDQRTLVHLMQTNPIMRHAAFQKMMFDAAAGSLARKQVAAHRQQHRAANVPPVVKPGTSGARTTVQQASLQALRNKLNQTGDAKDAAALLIAQRNARRR